MRRFFMTEMVTYLYRIAVFQRSDKSMGVMVVHKNTAQNDYIYITNVAPS